MVGLHGLRGMAGSELGKLGNFWRRQALARWIACDRQCLALGLGSGIGGTGKRRQDRWDRGSGGKMGGIGGAGGGDTAATG